MGWERVRRARGVWRPAKHIFVRKRGAIKRSRSPDIPTLPFRATQRAHGRILSQRAEIVQVMVTHIFKTQNPYKHWPKRVPGGMLSSMFY